MNKYFSGNSINGPKDMVVHKDDASTSSDNTENVLIAAKRLDTFLSQITETCPVILMPGEFDPSCHAMPQQPLHRKILSNSSRCEYSFLYTIMLFLIIK